jgi:phospholipase C
MATQRTATVNITNATDGNAWIQLFHKNSSNGMQSGMWLATPGQSVGPLTVNFETGFGTWGILDYWCVILRVLDGSAPGTYISNTGNVGDPQWYKECQLQSKDEGKILQFSVSTTTFSINEASGSCTDSMAKLTASTSPITNVFVVMLENHSFDNMLAMSGIKGITAATTANNNSYTDNNGNTTVYNVVNGAPLSMPSDPGHEFPDTLEQLAGLNANYPGGGPYPSINNSGFASNYATTNTEGNPPPSTDIGDIMACFDTPTQLLTTQQLASQFAVCDHWFSSLPGPTWPNRFFLHGASSNAIDYSPTPTQIGTWELPLLGFKYPHGSIYNALDNAGIPYRFYADRSNQFSDDPDKASFLGSIPQVTSLSGVTILDVNNINNLPADLANPYPYTYTFIEPNYGDVTGTYEGGSSQHPMDDVYGGEALLEFVYNAIRNSPLWSQSLLIITYDEQGLLLHPTMDQATVQNMVLILNNMA